MAVMKLVESVACSPVLILLSLSTENTPIHSIISRFTHSATNRRHSGKMSDIDSHRETPKNTQEMASKKRVRKIKRQVVKNLNLR